MIISDSNLSPEEVVEDFSTKLQDLTFRTHVALVVGFLGGVVGLFDCGFSFLGSDLRFLGQLLLNYYLFL